MVTPPRQALRGSVSSRGGSAAAAEDDDEGEEERRQRQEAAGYEARLAQELHGLQHGVSWLVAQLLLFDCGLPELVRLLLCLDFGCSLLQARLLQCLSRQLAAVSKGLVGQLPPEVAALSEPMRGQQL